MGNSLDCVHSYVMEKARLVAASLGALCLLMATVALFHHPSNHVSPESTTQLSWWGGSRPIKPSDWKPPGFPSFSMFHAHCQMEATVPTTCDKASAALHSELKSFQDP